MPLPAASGSPRLRYETLAPEFEVLIDGAPIEPAMQADLMGVAVIEDVDAPGTCEIRLQAWDGVRMQVRWIDDARLREGRAVQVRMGYQGDVRVLFDGDLTGLEPEFAEQESPALVVRGHDVRHRLMRERRSRSFTNMAEADLLDRIAADAGLQARAAQRGAPVAYALQHDQTDLEFLQQRAQDAGSELAVDGRTLVLRARPIEAAESLVLRREIELLEFYPRLSTLGQAPRLVARGWDPARKQPVEATAAAGSEPRRMGTAASGPAAAQAAFGQGAHTAVDVPVREPAEAERLAGGRFAEMALRFIRAEGVCIGEPQLRAGQVVRIEGLGERFSGPYYVTSTEHRFAQAGGYRTAFCARRNAT